MNELTSVLIGVDFSDCSKSAFVQAARIARLNDATLHVMHVIEELVAEEIAETLPCSTQEARDQIRADASKHLETWVQSLGSEVPNTVQLEVRIGVPIDDILAKVTEVGADLLVLGVTGAMGRLGGTGTLASKCVRVAPTKVLLINEGQQGPFETIVVAMDFSETSQVALEQGVRIAAKDGSQLHLLHVYFAPWHRSHYQAPTPEASPSFRLQYLEALRARLKASLDQLGASVLRGGLTIQCELFEATNHGRGIVEYSQKVGADLVVLGTRGRTNLKYVLLGSTAERVVREQTCSVLGVKPPDFSLPKT